MTHLNLHRIHFDLKQKCRHDLHVCLKEKPEYAFLSTSTSGTSWAIPGHLGQHSPVLGIAWSHAGVGQGTFLQSVFPLEHSHSKQGFVGPYGFHLSPCWYVTPSCTQAATKRVSNDVDCITLYKYFTGQYMNASVIGQCDSHSESTKLSGIAICF